jgi:hypothetical protein
MSIRKTRFSKSAQAILLVLVAQVGLLLFRRDVPGTISARSFARGAKTPWEARRPVRPGRLQVVGHHAVGEQPQCEEIHSCTLIL